jgi:retinol-binding protein 3
METETIIINPETQTEIIRILCEKLKANYVFPEVAEQISQNLQKHLENGDYAAIRESSALAAKLTEHLQEVNHDGHLNVWWFPQALPEQDGPIHLSPELQQEWQQGSRQNNYGLPKVERMPGNVGYVDIRGFDRPAWGGDVAAAAMTFVANTHVLIIDLRKCMGGDPAMVAFISTYIFSEETIHLNSLYDRGEDKTSQYWTLPYVPGRRFGEKPVYVLTSKTTFSGGEEFAYNLKTRKRATLVGETTGGGAHPGTTHRLHPHFAAFIPNGRAINPITGTNWEGCGVEPDIAVPQDQALNTAYRLALNSIIEGISEPRNRPADELYKEAQAALKELEAA